MLTAAGMEGDVLRILSRGEFRRSGGGMKDRDGSGRWIKNHIPLFLFFCEYSFDLIILP